MNTDLHRWMKTISRQSVFICGSTVLATSSITRQLRETSVISLLSRIASLWRNLSRRRQVERELTDEVSSYVELATQAKMKNGLAESEARREALVELGGVEQVKEQVRWRR